MCRRTRCYALGMTAAAEIHLAQSGLRRQNPLLGRRLIPTRSIGVALCDALAVLVSLSQTKLGFRVTGFGERSQHRGALDRFAAVHRAFGPATARLMPAPVQPQRQN